jgi:hypothetical membrane protein
MRYNADVNTLLVGASFSFYSKALARLFGVFGENNSPNTVSSEYQAFVGAWDLLVTTLVTMAATAPGFGNILGHVLGAGAAVTTSPASKHFAIRNIVEALYGETYYPGGSSGRREQKKLGTN